MRWYQFTKTQIETELQTSLETGLGSGEAKQRLIRSGPNALPEKQPDGWFLVFLRQFQSPLIYILIACSVIVYFLGETTDAIIILVVLLVNAVIGTLQEGKSGKILQSLKKLSQAEATVVRDGTEIIIPEKEVVKGDIVILQEGQRVAADARIVFGYNLGLDESSLTGESGAVLKKDQTLSEQNLAVANQHNMVFKGTSVLSGNGRAVVVGTGIETEIGKISKALMEPHDDIPLERNIKALSKVIIYAIGIISAALFALGLWAGHPLREIFSLVVSLAVSVIPEGLPLVLTVILATGVWRMSKKNALVKKLQAVEALGQARVLAVDKTGTVTENQMVIKQVYIGDKIYNITGNGYEPKGQAFLGAELQKNNSDLATAALVASLASRATVMLDESTGQYKVSGDPTEAAMIVFGEKFGFPKEVELEHYREIEEIPFDYKNKFRAVFYEHENKVLACVAGAPEVLLPHCSHFLAGGSSHENTAQYKKLLDGALEEFSAKGFRVVAFGFRHAPKNRPLDNINELVFGGFFGIEDAIRPEAKKSVLAAGSAGVKVVMITGDHKSTAKAIAREAGIYHEGDLVITGPELAEMTEQQLAEKLPRVSVFARVTPEDKMKIIKAYKHAGLIVAMTGDGVNDAPSLVAADLGVSMGKIGTEVAKEASDIVLLDDNLNSIVAAIQEGRVMYQNIKKALQFLFSTSLGELFSIVAALALKLPLPLTAVQILWMNLVTDPLLGAALAVEKKESEILDRQAGKYTKYFIDWQMLAHIVLVSVIMTIGALAICNVYYQADPVKAQTMALTLLSVFQWYNGLNCRFISKSIFNKRIFSNKFVWLSILANMLFQALAVYSPWFNNLLHIKPLSFMDWVVVMVLGLVVIFADEARKAVYRHLERRRKKQALPHHSLNPVRSAI